VDELEAADAKNARLKVHIRYSAKDGSLRIEDIIKNVEGDIRSCHVYLCGPLPMTMAFEKKFLELGMPKDNLHYEEFNFR
jgi:predicted ferric reductase